MSPGTTRVVKQMAGPCLPVYRAIINHIVDTGSAPSVDELAERARLSRSRVDAILAALAQQDWLALDDDGNLTSVYPFSVTPTGITVSLDGVERHAMCAIDALGVAPMLRRRVLITAACTECDMPIVISVAPDEIESYVPLSTVLTARYSTGAAFQTRCSIMRFACSPAHGRQWLDEHGAPRDVVLAVDEAFPLAREQFHRCYASGRVAKPFERKPPGAATA